MSKYSFTRKQKKEILAVHSANIERVISTLKTDQRVKKIKCDNLVAFDENQNPIFGYKVVVTYTE